MRLRYSSDARRDRREAAAYYNNISPHLRSAFQHDLRSALQYLIAYPLGAPTHTDDVRAKRLLHFPYTIFYRVQGSSVFILTIAHQARNPDDYTRLF